MAQRARCIAPDLIGMGRSDEPELAYRVEDHAHYFEAFVEALGLRDVVLVLHDWGSAIGLDWARRHEERVRRLTLMVASFGVSEGAMGQDFYGIPKVSVLSPGRRTGS